MFKQNLELIQKVTIHFFFFPFFIPSLFPSFFAPPFSTSSSSSLSSSPSAFPPPFINRICSGLVAFSYPALSSEISPSGIFYMYSFIGVKLTGTGTISFGL